MSPVNAARSAMGLLPPFALTGIGSLPHRNVEPALQLALACDLPWLPQLPRRSPAEFMLPLALAGFWGARFDDEGMVSLDVEAWLQGRAQGSGQEAGTLGLQGDAWAPFLFDLETQARPFAKIQLAGPYTVRQSLRLSRALTAEEDAMLGHDLLAWISVRALALVDAVRQRRSTPVIFFDEPGLVTLGQNAAGVRGLLDLRVCVTLARRQGALVGVHCCGNTDWPQLLALDLDVLSLECTLLPHLLKAHALALGRACARGMALCLGVVGTAPGQGTLPAEDVLRSIEAAQALCPAQPLHVMLSPVCGLGLSDVTHAQHAFSLARQLQTELRGRVAATAARA